MKKLLGFIFSILLFLQFSLAQEELPQPRVLPGHPLYGVTVIFERITIVITPGEEAKAKLRLRHAERRLAEAKALIERDKHERAKELIETYRSELTRVQGVISRRRRLGRKISSLAKHLSNTTYKHVSVLEEVLEEVPEEAKPAIELAINASSNISMSSLEEMGKEDPELAGKLASHFAEMEVRRAREMIRRGRIRLARRKMLRYKKFLSESELEMNRTEALGKNVTALVEHICNMTYKHIEVLESVLEEAPEEAKPAIELAINVSLKGHETCVERLLNLINKSEEEAKRIACTADAECEGVVYCPPRLKFEVSCYIPPNETIGICRCLPKWKKMKPLECVSDADCRHLICPMVVGSDTPICEEGRCVCGAKWEIVNRTEWRERFREEFTNRTQERIEKIRKIFRETRIEKLREKLEEHGEVQRGRP
jgi:hypothetical protein